MLDVSRSSIPLPAHFRDVRYNGDHFPGAPGTDGVAGGANCQQYAYAILRHHGFELPDLRSSDLWADTRHTAVVQQMAPFDLVMVHGNPDSWGAHVGICVGENLVLHLSKAIDAPAIETLEEIQRRDEYRYLIGFKRVLHRAPARVGSHL
jgi:hypothetical protein